MRHLFLLTTLFLFSGCFLDMKVIRGNGEIVVEEIDLDDFTDVKIGGHFKVQLYKSDNPGVIIETDENLIQHIDIEVKDNRLVINSNNTLRPSKELLIEVYYSEITGIQSSGASSIEHNEPLNSDELKVDLSGAGAIKLNLDVNELSLNLSGAGLVELKGRVRSEVVYLSGAGSLEAKDLESTYCEIHISGVGNAEVYVIRELNANISGMGNIEYYGDPTEIVQNVSGLGKVQKADESKRRQRGV